MADQRELPMPEMVRKTMQMNQEYIDRLRENLRDAKG